MFKSAMTTTTNGMSAYTNTSSAVLDFFSNAPTAYNDAALERAYNENKELALRSLLWLRDIRQGAGRREAFRKGLTWLIKNDPAAAIMLAYRVSEIGRWDDLLTFVDTPLENEAFALISQGLKDRNGLCAKWMPRKGRVAVKLREFLGMTPKHYRKTLVTLTNVVESQMCANEWSEVNYNHVPSQAALRYRAAFKRHDTERYSAYLESLANPKDKAAKVNAGAVYPNDIAFKTTKTDDQRLLDAQWEALPDFVKGRGNILPMVDVSGSMGSLAWGADKNEPIWHAISLGIYLAERNSEAFKDIFVTFHSDPEFVDLSDTKGLLNRVNKVAHAPWGMNTDLLKALRETLRRARASEVSQEEMPSMLLILSDMQFDTATSKGYWRGEPIEDFNPTALEAMSAEFASHGYKMPKIVFWNLNGSTGNSPVQAPMEGVAYVGGYSPSIMKAILSDNLESFTPYKVMLETLMSERYNF